MTRLNAWTPDRRVMLGNKRRLGDLLLANDFDGMESLIGALFAGIPNEWFTNNPIARYEGYYASVFYAYFASLGLDIVTEESSNTECLRKDAECNSAIPGGDLSEYSSFPLDRQRREPLFPCLSRALRYSTHSGRSMNIAGRDPPVTMPPPVPKSLFNRSQSSRVRLDLRLETHSSIADSRRGAILVSRACWHRCFISSNDASSQNAGELAARTSRVSR